MSKKLKFIRVVLALCALTMLVMLGKQLIDLIVIKQKKAVAEAKYEGSRAKYEAASVSEKNLMQVELANLTQAHKLVRAEKRMRLIYLQLCCFGLFVLGLIWYRASGVIR